MTMRHRTAALIWALGILFASAQIVGLLDPSPPTPPRYGPAEYCLHIGDDNCDGIITTNESGWPCVPAGGGPLTCVAGS